MAQQTVIPDSVDWVGGPDQHPYLVVDVFTSRAREGNQLGVFLDGRPFSSEQMQQLAREMNFAETVFLLPPRSEADVWVRIFTPSGELPFAGHPVLGTAFGREIEIRSGRPSARRARSCRIPIYAQLQLPMTFSALVASIDSGSGSTRFSEPPVFVSLSFPDPFGVGVPPAIQAGPSEGPVGEVSVTLVGYLAGNLVVPKRALISTVQSPLSGLIAGRVSVA